jgi:hypothetical protein
MLTEVNFILFSFLRINAFIMLKLSYYIPWRCLGEMIYSSYSFLTSALEGGEWPASCLGCALAPGKGPPLPILQEAGWASEPVWTQRLEEKSSFLCQGSNLNRLVHSQTLYWLSFGMLTSVVVVPKHFLNDHDKLPHSPVEGRMLDWLFAFRNKFLVENYFDINKSRPARFWRYILTVTHILALEILAFFHLQEPNLVTSHNYLQIIGFLQQSWWNVWSNFFSQTKHYTNKMLKPQRKWIPAIFWHRTTELRSHMILLQWCCQLLQRNVSGYYYMYLVLTVCLHSLSDRFLTFIGLTVQHLYQRRYFSLAERLYNVCTAASYLC